MNYNRLQFDETVEGSRHERKQAESALTLIDRLGPLYNGEHLNASAGEQYSGKNFGRDSAISASFLLHGLKYQTSEAEIRAGHNVVSQILRSLVFWQGQRGPNIGEVGRKNAEEPGKIHHESGPVTIDRLGLVNKWVDSDDKDNDMLVYFGSVDSTPLFVKTATSYIERLRTDDPSGFEAYSFMLESLPNFRGESIRMCDALVDALGWIEGRLESSELGLLEYYRLPGQEQGLRNQVWKDSLTSYVHQDGELANGNMPMASIEVQGLAYDALVQTAELFESDPVLARSSGVGSDRVENWRQQAQELQQRVLERFWVEPEGRFASAIDRGPTTGRPRHVKTPSSNELHLLNSRIFDSLDEDLRQKYVSSLAHQAVSKDFLTDIGIRCRSKAERQLISFADYHGSWVIWPWETHWIASGMRRQGLSGVADELDTRLHNSLLIAGGNREFFISDPSTDVSYYRFMPLEWAINEKIKADRITSTNIPDEPQAWSMAASEDIDAILSTKKETVQDVPLWVSDLQNELMKSMKKTDILGDKEQIEHLREISPIAAIDRIGGKAADALYYHSAGLQPLGSPGTGT